MRITKLITKREIALILNQILSTILKRNRWRSVWRLCMWILGLKRLRNRIPESGKSLLVESWILGFGIRNTAQGIRNSTNPESKFHWQKFGIQCLESGIDSVQSEIKVCLGLPYSRRYRLLISFILTLDQPALLIETLSDATVSWRYDPVIMTLAAIVIWRLTLTKASSRLSVTELRDSLNELPWFTPRIESHWRLQTGLSSHFISLLVF